MSCAGGNVKTAPRSVAEGVRRHVPTLTLMAVSPAAVAHCPTLATTVVTICSVTAIAHCPALGATTTAPHPVTACFALPRANSDADDSLISPLPPRCGGCVFSRGANIFCPAAPTSCRRISLAPPCQLVSVATGALPRRGCHVSSRSCGAGSSGGTLHVGGGSPLSCFLIKS